LVDGRRDDGRQLGKMRKEPLRARKPGESGVWTGLLGSPRDEEKEKGRFRPRRSSEVSTWNNSTKMPHAIKRRPQRRR